MSLEVCRPAARSEAQPDSFEAEALPHLRALNAAAWRLTGNAHDAEDLVQETFLRAYRSFDRYQPGTDIRAWLFTILYRARTDAIRRKARRLQTVSMTAEPTTAEARRGAIDGDDIARALAGLPEVFRGALVLRDVEGFSYEEVASLLGIPAGTVMSRIHRGRALMRRALSAAPTALDGAAAPA